MTLNGLAALNDWWWPLLTAPFLGSFIGTVARRLPAGRPIVRGRSACPHCDHILGATDLVPLVSWLARRGRCRYCGTTLGLFYPGIELASLLVAAMAVAVIPPDLVWLSCLFGWTLLTLAIIDWEHLLLPDPLTLPLIVVGLAMALIRWPDLALDHVVGAAVGYLGITAIDWCYRRLRGRPGIGQGDAKLLAAAGAWLSWTGLASVVLMAALAGLTVVFGKRLAGHPIDAREPVPFGAYLALATWVVWLYGPLAWL